MASGKIGIRHQNLLYLPVLYKYHMRYLLIKEKAVMMCYLVISLSLIFSLAQATYAQSSDEPVKACCEKTITGDTCIYTDASNCDTNGYKTAQFQTCEDTSFCRVGCCVDPNGGSCSKQTSQATCKDAGFEWSPTADCSNVKECVKGCCVLGGSSCAYSTEKRCNAILLDYPELTKDFRDAKSEMECSNKCREADKGCCVKDPNSECIYTSRVSCDMQEGTGSQGFYTNTFCSNQYLACSQCTPHFKTGCLEGTEDAYWFDSCGNPEDIALDCDFSKGSLCSHNDEDEAFCKEVNCGETWDNPSVEGDGTAKINGESWCEFDGAIGPSLDLPGSRHMRHLCINGEEIIEPCKDFREEICRQANMYEQETSTITGEQGTASATVYKDFLYSEAACKENRWKECTKTCNTARDKTDENERKIAVLFDKKCCERADLRDCYWAGNDTEGVCIPYHPPGFKMWETGAAAPAATPPTASTTSTQAQTNEQCGFATSSCKTIFTKDIYTSWKWVCADKGNCEVCFGDDYLQTQNNYCRSLGDCGAHYNYIGDFSDAGFTRFWDHGYEGWDKKYSHFMGSKATELTPEPKVLVTQEMAGGYQQEWKNADAEVYVSKASEKRGTTIKAVTGVVGGLLTLIQGLAGKAILGSFGKLAAGKLIGAKVGVAAWWIAFIVLAYVILTEIVFKKYETRTVQTSCGIWQAPKGGDKCGECGGEFKQCSEYRCRSLGATCKFIPENEGTNRPACYNAAPNDVNKPIIKPWKGTLVVATRGSEITSDFKVVETQTSYSITGAKKIPSFSRVTFGIETDELSQCRLGRTMKQTFNGLEMKFDEDVYDTKHNITMRNLMPATDYKLYVICKDPSGNPKDDGKTAPYVIQFATDNAPDLEPPMIVSSSIPDMGYVPYYANSTMLTLMVDDASPFTCKAATQDMPFGQMNINMSCAAMPQDSMFSKYAECQANLPITDGQNSYYFRCKDYPETTEQQNENAESVVWRATKAQPLQITNAEPTGIIYTTNATLQVVTAEGAQQGKATCYYDKVEFFSTNATYHTQKLEGLTKQDFNYLIECKDIANNVAASAINFTVDIDVDPPMIESIYGKGNEIRIALDEEASCQYSLEPPTYGKGTSTGTSAAHNIILDRLENVYFNCMDRFSNMMESVIVTKIQVKPPK